MQGSVDTRVPVTRRTGRASPSGRLVELLCPECFFSREFELNLGEIERLGSSPWVRLGPLTACRLPGAGPSPLGGGRRRQRQVGGRSSGVPWLLLA